ncbi:MAG TPA: hypothetical protein QGG59_04755 [Planctomycetota bacterium]|nr:hypothetical protein [Planctomycetota bacterium]MDP7245844.1 hypothetical protein [Planctomycetota bacterium]HJM39406.1 hypothetical protein [Planctomycetota bacterium]|tara:strand:- start:49403 stop:50839 length:1437 start_codon:yes stop_codon:yes gene_type:complete
MKRLLLVALACCALPQTVMAQGQDHQRLAKDQRQLAETARRLETLLELLENRELAEGNLQRADLLAGARERLLQATEGADLAAVMEGIASELWEQQTGAALEEQAHMVEELQALLDYLLKHELQAQMDSLLEAAFKKQAGIEKAIEEQKKLIAETEALQKGDLPKESAIEIAEQLQELAEQVSELSFGDPLLDEAAKAQKEASEKTESSPEESTEKQKEALEKLREAQKEAQRKSGELKQAQKMEELINLSKEIAAILERHVLSLSSMKDLHNEHPNGRTPRSARVKLRGLATEQVALSKEAEFLLTEVNTGGADAIPFLMSKLVDDHAWLGRALAPPSYRCGELEIETGEDIRLGWIEILEAIQTEAERMREQMEGGNMSAGPQSRRPLVRFAEELQLLKRLQTRHSKKLSRFTHRRALLTEAGMDIDQDDLRELDRLLLTQEELRQVYEAILARLEKEPSPAASGGDPPTEEEEVF